MKRALRTGIAAGLAVAATGCGGGGATTATTTATPPTTTTPILSPIERAALAKRRAAERPHFAAPDVQPGGRAALVRLVRRSILRDARARVAAHRLKGPILDVSCSVASDDRELLSAHPGAPVVRYSCLAVNFRANTSPPTQLGTPFVARVDFARGRYAWCEFTPVGGEGTHTAETFSVRPPDACVAPPPAP